MQESVFGWILVNILNDIYLSIENYVKYFLNVDQNLRWNKYMAGKYIEKP
jgi:hypothetical protein